MNKIYLSSDFHFGHSREFLYKPRGFESIEEHDNRIIENWNSIVASDDICYILGDCMLGDNTHGIECLKQLNGKLHIIAGNHCTNTRIELYKQLPNVIFEGYGMPLKYKKYHFFLSHYPTLTSNFDYDEPLKKQVISLCGHSHTKDKFVDIDKGLIYHVELDAHNNKPVLIDDIINDLKEYKETSI